VERRRAFRALLRNPLLPATGQTADQYALVRRHAEWLKHWFEKFPGWTLQINKEVARLRKLPPDLLDETRPATDLTSGTTFTRRRYGLFCLALAVVEHLDRQTTLRQIAQAIMELVAADRDLQTSGLDFDIGNYDHRRDLVHAVRLMADTGVLCRLDGEERHFLNSSDSDVLYDIDRHVLAALLQSSRSPSVIAGAGRQTRGDSVTERAAKLGEHQIPSTEEERNRWIRSRLMRALLDDPIVYFSELNDEERTYLEKHRGYLLRQVTEATGLIAEVRSEGIAMMDSVGDLTDLKLPEEGMNGHLALLLAQWLAGWVRSGSQAAIPISAVEDEVRQLIQVHGSEWRKEARGAGAETRLAQDALFRLQALRLIQVTASGVIPLAACGRYAPASSEVSTAR
jgi:uncharacterized protein (TIGR02678 family)